MAFICLSLALYVSCSRLKVLGFEGLGVRADFLEWSGTFQLLGNDAACKGAP